MTRYAGAGWVVDLVTLTGAPAPGGRELGRESAGDGTSWRVKRHGFYAGKAADWAVVGDLVGDDLAALRLVEAPTPTGHTTPKPEDTMTASYDILDHATCAPADHDRTPHDPEDPDGALQAVADDGLLGCNDCRRPLFYCTRDDQYWHVDPDAACFLAPAWGRSNPGPGPADPPDDFGGPGSDTREREQYEAEYGADDITGLPMAGPDVDIEAADVDEAHAEALVEYDRRRDDQLRAELDRRFVVPGHEDDPGYLTPGEVADCEANDVDPARVGAIVAGVITGKVTP